MSSYRPDIDGLRAIAIIPVVLYHAGFPFVSGGFVGVDVFLVISGYLITQILHRELTANRFSLIGFYERRARRILPALTVVLFSSLGVGYFVLLPSEFERLSRSAIATTLFSSNFWFWQAAADYFAPSAEYEPLLHTWTLSVEEQFYVLFPPLLLFLSRWPTRTAFRIVGVVSVLSFGLSAVGVATYPSATFYLTPTRAWELGLGALMALGLKFNLSRRWLREGLAAGGLAGILIAIVVFDSATPFPGLAALLPCVGAALLIMAGAQGGSLAGRLLSCAPLVFVGLISYSLYLWHWPVLTFLRIIHNSVHLPDNLALAAVAASFVMAVLSWAVVERPFRRRPPEGFSRATIFGLSGAAAAGAVALSLFIVIGSGLPTRFDHRVLEAYAGTQDTNPDRDRCLGAWPNDALCRFGATTEPDHPADFLLWGDSHASAIMPGIADAARQTGSVGIFAGMSACPPLLGVERVDKGPKHDCARFNTQVFEELQSRNDAPIVILMARWYLTAEGYRAQHEDGNSALLAWAERPNNGSENPERNFEIFRQALSNTVAAILSTGRRVVLLGGIPEIGWNVPRGIGDHLRWGKSLPPVPTIESISSRHRRADSVLSELANLSGMTYLPVAHLLCDSICQTNIEGRPLYSDGDHLSHFGAVKIIKPLFRKHVLPLIKQPGEKSF